MASNKDKNVEPQSPLTDKELVSLEGLTEEKEKPWHVKFIFYGFIILTIITTAFLLDLGITNLVSWYTTAIAGLDFYTSITVTLSARVIGLVILIMAIWINYLGFPLYERRPGRILTWFLLVSIGFILIFGLSIGLGLIYFFMIFLWKPKFILHWSKRMQDFYRYIVVTVILLWMAIEFILASGILGVRLAQLFLIAPLGTLLRPFGLSVISLIGLFIIFPVYIMVPRFWKSLYNARPRIEGFWTEYAREWMGLVGIIIIGTFIIMGIFADFLAPFHWSYRILDITTYLLPPSPGHILGTNQYGQDIFSRVIYGARISLIVGFSASIIAVVIGTITGLVAGYFGGTLDHILMRITDVFLSLPTLPLMLIFLMFFGQGLQNIIIVIAILGWTGTARMVRSETLSLRERPLTEAAHAIGASDIWIIVKHILPNVLPLILANMILGIVNAILAEAGITFLGFGDIFGAPSWGIILHNASKSGALVNGAWWWLIPPGLCILFTALGFAFVSHSADKVVNPRLRKRR